MTMRFGVVPFIRLLWPVNLFFPFFKKNMLYPSDHYICQSVVFSRYTSFPPPIKLTATIITEKSNSTQQKSNYIYLYTTKFGTSIKIWLNRKFESTQFETMRINCIYICNQCLSPLKLWVWIVRFWSSMQ
jgi:hypothetical protein